MPRFRIRSTTHRKNAQISTVTITTKDTGSTGDAAGDTEINGDFGK